MMQKRGKNDFNHSSIPEKANVVLNLILIALILIALRIWHLTVVQYDEKFEQSKRPQRKTVIESAKRATIRDRFNIPLAFNKIAYSAGVTYSPIRQIPTSVFEPDETGKKIKIFQRKNYVRKLSEFLAQELDLDEKRVEDQIHSKAALYFNIPYILKYEISEKQYYRLRMLEKDWPGLTVQRYSKREYPKEYSSSDVIGYMGAISREEFDQIIYEKKVLGDYLSQWENGEDPPPPLHFSSASEVRKRYKDLELLAYTAQDYVGKTGIEALFEQQLRGFQGKKTFYSDSRGNFIKELPGSRPPLPGKRILLSLSAELQEYAEQLLAQNEQIRTAKSSGHGKKIKNQKQPWIKGGAIVVVDPKSGEVLTLASYPRFNPNDFLANKESDSSKQKRSNINKWFENESYIADVWNEFIPLQKELFDSSLEKFYEEKKWLTWPVFLEMLLPKEHSIVKWFEAHDTLADVAPLLTLADDLEAKGGNLNTLFRSSRPEDQSLIESHPLASHLAFLETPYTKMLFLDCCQLALDHSSFDNDLLQATSHQTLTAHKEASSAYHSFKNAVKQMTQELFHEEIFSRWRELNEKKFLKEKREEEKLTKTYPKPYLDYLDEKEQTLFSSFWKRVEVDFCLILLNGTSSYDKMNCFTAYFKQLHEELAKGAHPALPWKSSYDKLLQATKKIPREFLKNYLGSLRSYSELDHPLRGVYRSLRNKSSKLLGKHLAAAFYPTYGYGYGRSFAYRQASTQGSIFKIITAHEALLQTNEASLLAGKGIKNFNPLEMVDDIFKMGNHTYVGYNEFGKPISQIYKGGRIPRSHAPRMGKMDLLTAIETSSNPYFSLLAGDVLRSPTDLANAARRFGFGKKTGIELPGEINGRIPEDLETNRTGLYATAIGQHSLVVTPLQTALFLSSLANGGQMLKPQIIKFLVGSSLNHEEGWLYADPSHESQQLLSILGLDFPLFSNGAPFKKKIQVEEYSKIVKGQVEMPPSLRNLLLEGMRRVVNRTHQVSLRSLSRLYANHPEAISDYVDFKNQIIGKTSTSESMERIDFDEHEGTNLYTHVWFGGISFENDVTNMFEKPELVVVVYLRFGAFGNEAAPLAAQIVRKWREIKLNHQ